MSTTGIGLPAYKERLRREAAARGAPDAEVEAFLAVMRPRVGLISEPDDGGVVFRYGGLPRMPDGVDWPGSSPTSTTEPENTVTGRHAGPPGDAPPSIVPTGLPEFPLSAGAGRGART